MADPILHDLHKLPKASDPYLWCDYIELRCIVDVDQKFSRGDLLELLAEAGEIADEDFDDADSDDDEEPDADESADGDENADTAAAAVLPKADRHETKVSWLFKSLVYRASLFGDAYPFELDAANQELSLRPADTTVRLMYLQLLLSASLRLVPRKRRPELTDPFEKMSAEIFRCLMPNGWEVHRFGATAKARYTGHLFDRFKKLAADLRAELTVKRAHYKRINTGDGGLDIVAWHPMGDDERVGIPIALAQCGCTAEEWTLKSLEASPSRLAHLRAHHRWATYYFMPQDLSTSIDGKNDWQRRPSLTDCIVVDRLRLIRLAVQYDVTDKCMNAKKPVEEALALEAA